MADTSRNVTDADRTERTRAQNRERQRLRRMRQSLGVRVFKIEIDPDTLGALMDRGLIDPVDVNSKSMPAALGTALEDLLMNVSRRDWRRS